MKKPRPLVVVFRRSEGTWEWQCDRCDHGAWQRQWKATFEGALRHVEKHANTGFQPPKGR